MPLPPYIHENWMTVNAIKPSTPRKVALLLHQLLDFTSPKELLAEIQAKGVHLVYLTLHVGLGTFRPVSVDNLDEHRNALRNSTSFLRKAAATLRSVKENGACHRFRNHFYTHF